MSVIPFEMACLCVFQFYLKCESEFLSAFQSVTQCAFLFQFGLESELVFLFSFPYYWECALLLESVTSSQSLSQFVLVCVSQFLS